MIELIRRGYADGRAGLPFCDADVPDGWRVDVYCLAHDFGKLVRRWAS